MTKKTPPKRANLQGSLSKLMQATKDKKEGVQLEDGQEITKLISLDSLQAGKCQPRKTFDDETLKELADSIKHQGIIQPIVVRKIDDENFEIVAGERRWRASKLAGLETIPAIVRELDDKTTLAMALVENLQREDLKPMDEAEALQQLKKEFKLKDVEIAEMIGKSKSEISRLFGLLKLPDCLKALYERGVTSQSVLFELTSAYKKNPEETESFVTDKNEITMKEASNFKNREKIKAEEDKKVPTLELSETQEKDSSSENDANSAEQKTEIVDTQPEDKKDEPETKETEDEKSLISEVTETKETEPSSEIETTVPKSKEEVETSSTEPEPKIEDPEHPEQITKTEISSADKEPEIKADTKKPEDRKVSMSKLSEKETEEPNDNGKDFTESLDQQSTGSSETPFIDSVSNDDLLAILVEYKNEDYYIVMDRKCDDSKFCFIKNKDGDELRVEVLDLVIVAIE